MFKNRYRAKKDIDGGVILQTKHWYFPFVWQHVKYTSSLAKAKEMADCLRLKPIEL